MPSRSASRARPSPYAAFVAAVERRPEHVGLVLDVDGCLANLEQDFTKTAVDSAMRRTLLACRDSRIGSLTVLTARHPRRAREIIGIPDITYSGYLGGAVLRPNSDTVEIHQQIDPWRAAVSDYSAAMWRSLVDASGVAAEHFGDGQVCYEFGGLPPSATLTALIDQLEQTAVALGLFVHRNATTLVVSPPISLSKATGMREAVAASGARVVMYAGDSVADVPAMQAIDAMLIDGTLESALKVVVRSAATVPSLTQCADLTVPGGPSALRLRLQRFADLAGPAVPPPTRSRGPGRTLG